MNDERRTKEDLAADLYYEMLEELLAKVRDGSATPSDRKLIRQIAEDHDVQVDPTDPEGPFGTAPDVPFSYEDMVVKSEEQ